MEQDNPSVFDLLVGDRDRAVAEGHFKPAHGRSRMSLSTFCLPPSFAPKPSRPVCDSLPATAATSRASRVSGRTATDCGFAARSADLPFRRGGVRPAALPFGPLEETRVDARSDCNAVPRRLPGRAADEDAQFHSWHAIPDCARTRDPRTDRQLARDRGAAAEPPLAVDRRLETTPTRAAGADRRAREHRVSIGVQI